MTISLWLDGCFDGFHYAHANVIRQALYLLQDNSRPRIVVGVHSDQEILKNKGPALFEETERYALLRGCRWVDEVVEDVPYVTAIDVTREKNIDFVVHGDDPVYDANGQDCYGTYKAEDKYLECKRTKGISTTDLIQRLLLPEGRAAEEIDEGCLETLVNEFATAVPYPFPVIRYKDLKSLADLDTIRNSWPTRKKIVYVGGSWDCFGSGHVEYLRRCKALLGSESTVLVVGVWSDDVLEKTTRERPLLLLLERTLAVIQCKYADAVITSSPPVMSESITASLGLDVLINAENDTPTDERVHLYVDVPRLPSIETVRKRLTSQRGLYEERQRRKRQPPVAFN